MNPWLIFLLILVAVIVVIWWLQRKIPRPEELFHRLEQAPLRTKLYGHIRKINNQHPRYVVGNDHIGVAYWRTRYPHQGDVVETILFLHPIKKGEVVVTFRNGVFALWSWFGVSGPPINQQNALILERILAKVKAAHL